MGRVAWLGCLLGVAFACKPQPPAPAASSGSAAPQMRATVVTIRTTTAPANKTMTNELVISDGKARLGSEVDRWRLFDFNNKRVVFVDELTKSYRTASFDSILAGRRKSLAEMPPAGAAPHATFQKTANVRQIAGVTGTQYVIRTGRYERQLWIGQHPAIPPSLFALMIASQPETTPVGTIDREPARALLDLTGFPLVDHSELPYDAKSIAIERTVVGVQEKNVPAGWLDIPKGFKDNTVAPTKPAVRNVGK